MTQRKARTDTAGSRHAHEDF